MVLNTGASISLSQINSTVYFTNGNLGINTTNPSANLDVAGTISASGLSALANVTATNVSTANVIITSNLTAPNANVTNLTVSNLNANGNFTLISANQGNAGSIVNTNAFGFAALEYENNVRKWYLGVGGSNVTESLSDEFYLTWDGNPVGAITVSTNGNVSLPAKLDVAGLSALANITATNITSSTLIATTSVSSGLLSATNVIGNSISAGTLIGTTITGANLSLSGNLNIAGTLTTVNITSTNLVQTNVSTGTIYASGTSTLQNVTVNGTLQAAGSIVVGPTGSGIHMGLDINGYCQLQLNSNAGSYIDFSTSGSDFLSRLIFANSNNFLSLENGGATPVIAVTSTGNVGIGIASPSANLHIVGTMIATTSVSSGLLSATNVIGNSISAGTLIGTTITGGNLSLSGTSTLQNVTATNVSTGVLAASRLNVTSTENNGGLAYFINPSGGCELGVGQSLATNNIGLLNFNYVGAASENNSLGLGFYAGNNKLCLKANGNVGIGTSNPGYTLEVNGTGRFNGTLDIVNSSPILTIKQSDNTDGKIYFGNSNHGVGRNAQISTLTNANDVTLWTAGEGSVGFGTTTGEGMRINASGNVGIGTSSPTHKLHVNGAICLEGGTALEPIGGTQIDSSNLTQTYISFGLAGTGNDWAYLRQIGGDNAYKMALDIHDDGDEPGFCIRSVASSSNPDIINERFTVQANGNVGIGTSSPSGMLHLNNAALFTSTGNLTCTGDIISFGSLSDARLKKNIEAITTEKALDVVKGLNSVAFDWNDDVFNESKRNTHDIGFIAQEVEELVPEAIAEYTEIESGNVYKSIKHERLIPYLLKAIQYLLDKE